MKNLIWCFLLMVIVSCNKTVSELPAATQTGANTFGAQVNGSFFVPKGFGIVPTAPILEARYMPNRDIIINARNFAAEPEETEFEIYLKHVVTPGVYLLNSTTGVYPNQSANYGYYIKRKINPINEWVTTPQYTGKVEITKTDTVNKILSGTFEFNAINMYSDPVPLTVTNGRFDVQLQ